MKRKRKFRVLGTIALPSGVKWDDLEFRDDIKAIAREQAKADRIARKRFEEQGRIIAADFERERQQQLAEALRKQAQYRLDLKLAELDEKMQSGIDADREEAKRVFKAYTERVAASFRAAVQEQGKCLMQVNEWLEKIQADEQRSRLREERIRVMERGVVRLYGWRRITVGDRANNRTYLCGVPLK